MDHQLSQVFSSRAKVGHSFSAFLPCPGPVLHFSSDRSALGATSVLDKKEEKIQIFLRDSNIENNLEEFYSGAVCLQDAGMNKYAQRRRVSDTFELLKCELE